MAISMTLDASQIYPALPTIADKAEEVCKKIDLITSVKIRSGFPCRMRGVDYTLSSELTDQQNLTQAGIQLSLCESAGVPFVMPYRFHPVDGSDAVTIDLTADEFKQVAAAFATFKSTCLSDGWVLKAAAKACKDERELKAFVDANNLEIRHRDATYAAAEMDPTV